MMDTELKDGQIYRWHWKPGEQIGVQDAYWCKSCIGIVKGGQLFDTYWSSDRYAVDLSRVDLKLMGDQIWPQLRPGEELRYDPADICDTRHGNNSRGPIYVRPGAQLNKAAMIAELDRREDEARSDIRMAEWRLEEIVKKRALLDADKLAEVML